MKKWHWQFISIAALLWVPVALFAQSPRIDSLFRELATAPPDTHRVFLLVDIAWDINETNTDEAERLLQEAIRLARQLKFNKGEAFALNGLGVVEEIRGNYAQSVAYYKRALEIRRNIGDLREIGSSLNNLGISYEFQGRFDSALVFHRENFSIQEKLRDTVKIARALFNIASAYQGADMVYAKSWGALPYFGRWDEEKPIRERHRHFMVDSEKLNLSPDALFSHCLPVRRNVKVTDEVLDSARAIHIDEAENRLHVQKALLHALLTGEL